MSSGSCGSEVNKCLVNLIDQVVEVRKADDARVLAEFCQTDSSIENSFADGDASFTENRRSGRTRKQPDRLVIQSATKPKEEPFACEVVMEAAPPDLRGILKQRTTPFTEPPTRKASLTATAGMNILKKYRRVRITRHLKFKVIPPLPGWRPEYSRLPDAVPDEEEQRRQDELDRLDKLAEQEEEAKKKMTAAEKRKKRKRKSLGPPPPPVGDSATADENTAEEEEFSIADLATPASPDVFFDGYMKEYSPDSVLTSDSETDERREERRRKIAVVRSTVPPFPSIDESSPTDDNDGNKQQQSTTVGGGPAPEDTVATANNGEQPVDAAAKKTQRRRSVRIQPLEEEKPKAIAATEKRERRKSKMFPVTPLKESPLAAKSTAPERSTATRRRSGVVRSLPTPKSDEEESEAASTSARNPYTNDDPCRSAEKRAADDTRLMKRKSSKVAAWLARPDMPAAADEQGDAPAAAAVGSGGARGDGLKAPDLVKPANAAGGAATTEDADVVENARGADSRDSQLTEESGSSNGLVEVAKQSEQQQAAAAGKTQRKGRRSMYVQPPKEEEDSQLTDESGSGNGLVEVAKQSEQQQAAAAGKTQRKGRRSMYVPPPKEDYSQLTDESGSGSGLVEVAKQSEQQQAAAGKTQRKGRRSMYVPKEEVRAREGGEGKENKAVRKSSTSSSSSSTTSSSKSSNKSEKKKETQEKAKQHHPFFSQFVPKPSPLAAEVTVAAAPPPPPPAEKKPSRRRTMFVPKKPAKKEEEDEKTEEEEKEEDEEEDVIEILAEVTKAKKQKAAGEEEGEGSVTTATSIWRSSEIDAAPYAGLVHVGRETDEEREKENGGEDRAGEEVVRKMRRLSVRLPTPSSYAIPASLRNEKADADPEMIPVFDAERKEGVTGKAGKASHRARNLRIDDAPDEAYAWPEALRPRTVEECLGDKEVLAEGKRWLQKWKKRLDAACEEEEQATKAPKAKRKKRRGGSYSDESEQEDSDSDYEVRDDERDRLPNPLVLSGPIGCGKTAYIRALSSDVGFSILESAPDERRTGINLRAKLAGAVANYRISKPVGGIASFFAAKAGGDKTKEEEAVKKGRQHTLVVIEHIDVIFTEEDRLFWPALAEILTTTKIPIVLICNVVPDELTRVLAQAEAAGGAEALEMTMDRGGRVAEYVEGSLTGSCNRYASATVVRAIASRARLDLRATLHDAHWAAAATSICQADLAHASMRRVDAPTMCDTVAAQSFAWSDECARRADATSSSELCRAAEWPTRRGMHGDTYARLCKQIDEIDQDASRDATARAERAMEMARSGVSAGSRGRAMLLTRHEIAHDWMPILEQIDRAEQQKRKEYGRRHQHYFNVIKDLETGASIDPLDRIQAACAFFRLPTTTNRELTD